MNRNTTIKLLVIATILLITSVFFGIKTKEAFFIIPAFIAFVMKITTIHQLMVIYNIKHNEL
jgi:ABC-type multidrug transport system permease subunit